ncbi:MAG: hypothetical protein Q8Q26_02625 [Pseudorhodobacter sp.]|nr:hypothetical protein [Pseudorhodobacter sp.]
MRGTYSSQCAVCHSANKPASRAALEWQAEVQTYGPKTSLTKEEERLVLRYLQLNSWDTVAQGAEL